MSTLRMSNRTGVARAGELTERMIEATREFPPSGDGDASGLAEVRAGYLRASDPIGTMPPPAGVKQAATAAAGAMAGGSPLLLLDKLGERLAFERTGTRLYDAMLSKVDATRALRGGPTREDLLHIREEEAAHVAMVHDMIASLGGDPTVVTPSADVQTVASKGVVEVLADPRCDVLQSLEALLVAELVDNDCWAALIELAEQAGQPEFVRRMGEARAHEEEHLTRVRAWLAAGQGRSGKGARPAAPPARTRAATGTEARPRASGRRATRARTAKARGKTARTRTRAKRRTAR
jgi:rubrerythrin